MPGSTIITILLGSRDDRLALGVPPLARGVEHGQAGRKARRDLAVDETRPVRLGHADPAADLAAEHQFGDRCGFWPPRHSVDWASAVAGQGEARATAAAAMARMTARATGSSR